MATDSIHAGMTGGDTSGLGEQDTVDVRHLGFVALAWRRFRKHKLALVAAVLLIMLTGSAILAPWVSPYDPNHGDFSAFNSAPTSAHPMGTDFTGRDILSRVLYGGRISLLIGFSSMLTAIVFGTMLGAVAGYFGGWVDNLIMRLTDVVLSFPLYLLLFVLSAFIAGQSGGKNVLMIVLIIMAVSWTYIARLLRGEFLSLKEREFVQAARAVGTGSAGIITRHLLPNAIAPIVVNATLLVGNSIILESVLSFFGFGVQPPTSSWGSMLADGLPNQATAPWGTIYPGMMILLTVLSVNLLGDGLRDALDPFSTKK
ncbi:MAG: peptide transporter permease [Chloroflexi bacterium]|jgi:peptide/nickel transport system permease protein|nr:peptide transporter permease [Chloroflexota bacterium]